MAGVTHISVLRTSMTRIISGLIKIVLVAYVHMTRCHCSSIVVSIGKTWLPSFSSPLQGRLAGHDQSQGDQYRSMITDSHHVKSQWNCAPAHGTGSGRTTAAGYIVAPWNLQHQTCKPRAVYTAIGCLVYRQENWLDCWVCRMGVQVCWHI